MGFWEDITGVTAANKAAAAQTAGTQASIAEQRRQFDAMQGLMDPFVRAGTQSLEQQQALAGALGPEAQQAAYDAIQAGPGFQSALQRGETSILQNAAATGGVRGGNTQGALAQFSPALLNQSINQRFGQLGGLTQMGQASAAGVGAAGMNMGANVGAGLQNIGNIGAQQELAGYNRQRGFVGDMFGGIMGLGGLGIDLASSGLF